MKLIFAILFICASFLSFAEDAKPARLDAGEKLVFSFANFANVKDADEKIALMKRAKAAGYTGLFISDTKMAKFQLQSDSYIKAAQRFRQACADEKIKLFLGVAEFGYSQDMLTSDPNLAEGFPVRKAAFVVKDGKLVPDDEGVSLQNGNFAESNGKFAGWNLGAFKADASVKFQDHPAVLWEAGAQGAPRVIQRLKVKPNHAYHVSVMAKTDGFTGKDNRIQLVAVDGNPGNIVLSWQPPNIKETMDWTQLHCTFDSLDNTEVQLMIGTWAPKAGKLWLADVKLEPNGFVNILRRDSLPLTITSEDGQTTFEEGKDFTSVADPKLLNDPNPGYYTIWHQPPTVSAIGTGKLREGQKLLASYHFLASCGKPGQVTVCPAEQKIYDVIDRQVAWVKKNFDPDGYMMSYDEIRQQGFDDSCLHSGKTPGELLADSVRKVTAIIKKHAPGKSILVWNDMFDPFHNAPVKIEKHNPYLVKGTKELGGMANSWDGLSPDVVVVTWMKNPESAKFFSDRGHQVVLAGYYDHDPKLIADWLKSVDASKNVTGVMYTTWKKEYKDLEAFSEAAKK